MSTQRRTLSREPARLGAGLREPDSARLGIQGIQGMTLSGAALSDVAGHLAEIGTT